MFYCFCYILSMNRKMSMDVLLNVCANYFSACSTIKILAASLKYSTPTQEFSNCSHRPRRNYVRITEGSEFLRAKIFKGELYNVTG